MSEGIAKAGRGIRSPELELQVVVNQAKWELGT